MHGNLFFPLFLSFLYLAFNAAIYLRIKQWYGTKSFWNILNISFWISLLIVIAGLFQLYFRFKDPTIFPSWYSNYFIGFAFSLMLGKLLYGAILILDFVLGSPWFVVSKINKTTHQYSTTRRKFVQGTSTLVAGLPFLSLIQGITFGKYDYHVRKVSLSFPDLPKAFDGFKIAQISDIHSGSFDDKAAVLKGIKMINEQLADLIVFTGDLVNARSKEIVPFIDVFDKLKAPEGVMSIKGNHDYGLYYKWESENDLASDQQEMLDHHKTLGFDLLNNTNRIIEKDGESISIIGVENWGLPPFPQVGDLDKALSGSEKTPFTILLSHDPSHWDEVVLNHPRKVHLTLSGHTHGMQFGVEIPGFKWSPVEYRYPRWAGLYTEKNQHLYVNRGFGFIGYPGRVGIMPEITVFELKSA